jgi:nucleotide-binding universal stress UspA family protein
MSGHVIACLDDGPTGSSVARVGVSLARRLCSPLMLATVTAAEAPRATGGDHTVPPEAHARSVLLRRARSTFADAAIGVGPDPELRVELGEPAERLTSLAQQVAAQLLVVGVPNRCVAPGSGLGNAYLALAGTSPCPVVAVTSSALEVPPSSAPIVCGVDGSDESLAATGVAVDLARRLGAPLQLVHVTNRPRLSGGRHGDPGYGARLVASHAAAIRVLLRAANVPQEALDLRVELGPPADRLADVATREGAQLIVIGSRGRGARRSALVGSVSSRLARTGSQPIVLVRAEVGVTYVPRDGNRASAAYELRRPGLSRRGSSRRHGDAVRGRAGTSRHR